MLLAVYWCLTSFQKSAASPVVNPLSSGSKYAIVVDAGSSGSRIFVYCVDTENSPPGEIPIITLCKDAEYKPVVKKKTPGISSFAGRTSEVEPYISDLIQMASDYIPVVAHSSTPLYILATAGMRLLTEVQQEAIWAAVRRTIKTKFSFNFEDSCAQTVSGLYEALFGWTTVNYLLGKLSANHYPSDTVGMLDMGGASMQIAYEVPAETSVPEDLIMNFTVGKVNTTSRRNYRVYVMTFLSYGTHASSSRHKAHLLENALEYSPYAGLLKARFRPTSDHPRPPREPEAEVRLVYTDDNEPKFIISDPCLQPGRETILTTEDLIISRRLSATRQASGIPAVVFQGTGNLTLCIASQKVLLKKDSPCPTAPCSMNGVHQPPIDFTKAKFYAMSEYWYTSADLDNRVNTYGFPEFQNLAKVIFNT
ncbi:Ectonucleoside triphosphate diphosphohydrolase [Sparganum proliferum]